MSRAWQSFAASDLKWTLLTLVVAAIAWQVAATAMNSISVPTFSETAVAIPRLLADPVLWQAMLISNQSMVIGFAISLAIGLPLGLFMGRFRFAEKVFDPYLNIILVAPMAMLIPLLIFSVGIGLASRVILVVLFSFVVISVNTRAGVRQVDPALIEMGRSFGASERLLWWRIILRAAMPSVIAGLRLGLSRAVAGMVIVELLMVSVGLGGLILRFRGFFQADLLMATVVIIVLEVSILLSILAWIERRLIPWAR